MELMAEAQHVKLARAAETDAQQAKARNTLVGRVLITLKQMLRNALAGINSEHFPTAPEAQEGYFQEQVAMGEALATQGPDAFVPSALSFYRALKVYPNPVELIMSA